MKIRAISELALHSEAIMHTSEEILNRIRLICLSQFQSAPKTDNREETVSIPITSHQLKPILDESIAKSHTARKDLLSRVIRGYFEARNNVRFHPADYRLSIWMNKAHQKFIQYLENSNQVELVEIPKEWRKFSCFRYALTRVGVKIDGLLTEKEFRRLLLEGDFQSVDQPVRGDLVLFSDGLNPKHLGIYQENGYILSKEGDASPVAYVKRLEDFTPQYGDKILYLRPSKNHLNEQVVEKNVAL